MDPKIYELSCFYWKGRMCKISEVYGAKRGSGHEEVINIQSNNLCNIRAEQNITKHMKLMQNMCQHGGQNGARNRFENDFGSPGPPRDAQGPPRGLHGARWEAFWTLRVSFWTPGGSFSSFFGVHVCFDVLAALLLLVLFFLMRPLLCCSPSELSGYEAQVTKAVAS